MGKARNPNLNLLNNILDYYSFHNDFSLLLLSLLLQEKYPFFHIERSWSLDKSVCSPKEEG